MIPVAIHQGTRTQEEVRRLKNIFNDLGIALHLEEEEIKVLQQKSNDFFNLFVSAMFQNGLSSHEIERYAWQLQDMLAISTHPVQS